MKIVDKTVTMFISMFTKIGIFLLFCGNSSQSPSCECGEANDKMEIDGGTETVPHKFPWMVQFRMEWNFNERQLGCTGSLLDSSHVLIAAHCLKWCCGRTKACPTCREDQTGEMTVRDCP